MNAPRGTDMPWEGWYVALCTKHHLRCACIDHVIIIHWWLPDFVPKHDFTYKSYRQMLILCVKEALIFSSVFYWALGISHKRVFAVGYNNSFLIKSVCLKLHNYQKIILMFLKCSNISNCLSVICTWIFFLINKVTTISGYL